MKTFKVCCLIIVLIINFVNAAVEDEDYCYEIKFNQIPCARNSYERRLEFDLEVVCHYDSKSCCFIDIEKTQQQCYLSAPEMEILDNKADTYENVIVLDKRKFRHFGTSPGNIGFPVLRAVKDNVDKKFYDLESVKVYFGTLGDIYLIVHGFTGHRENTREWADPLINSLYQRNPKAIIIFVEWKKGASKGDTFFYYRQPASNTRHVGKMLARILEPHYQNPNAINQKIWCFGFSLGGQVCGFTGKELKKVGFFF